jgi:hypothetical protein
MATAKELETALRARANSLKNDANVVSIQGLTFRFTDGSEKTIKLNNDKTWRSKPTVYKPTENGEVELLKIEWCDPNKTQSNNEINNEGNRVYFLTEQVEEMYIDPAKVVDYKFNYVYKRVTEVEVISDNNGEEPTEPQQTE